MKILKHIIKLMTMISNCCGAPSYGGEDYGICSDCGEHCEYVDELVDDYPVLPDTQVDETYKRVSKWFGVGLLLIIIILICL